MRPLGAPSIEMSKYTVCVTSASFLPLPPAAPPPKALAMSSKKPYVENCIHEPKLNLVRLFKLGQDALIK